MISHTPHIAVVEDEAVTRSLIEAYLRKENFRVSSMDNSEALFTLLRKDPVDLVLLDINLPGQDGLTVARLLRAESAMGIILVTQRKDEVDRVLGLELGADDYVTKPFSPRELMARVRTVLRRLQGAGQGERDAIRFAGWTFNLLRRCLISPEDKMVHLTTGEFQVLCALVQHAGTVMSRETLLDCIDKHTAQTKRTVDVLIGRLRKKLGDDVQEPRFITTVHGAGYVFSAPIE